jgi:hypothetical protein
MQNQSVEIAKTIQHQLMTLGKIKVWSWGAHAWTVVENGLAFKVQGFKFKGVVKIELKGNDTYTIQFIKNKKVEKEYTEVYFDQQVDLIDEFVEFTGANYENDVNKAVYHF